MIDCVVRVDTRSLKGCDGEREGDRKRRAQKSWVATNKYFFLALTPWRLVTGARVGGAPQAGAGGGMAATRIDWQASRSD